MSYIDEKFLETHGIKNYAFVYSPNIMVTLKSKRSYAIATRMLQFRTVEEVKEHFNQFKIVYIYVLDKPSAINVYAKTQRYHMRCASFKEEAYNEYNPNLMFLWQDHLRSV